MINLKQRLEKQLKDARHMSEQLLEAFKTPQQWTYQVHPNANHALWFAGHMGLVDNFMVGLLAPERAKPRKDIEEKFGMGSKPVSDPAAYPKADDVLGYMRERRLALLDVLAGLKDDDMARPLKGGPEFLSDVGSVFEMAVYHEGLHAGQMSVARRGLGNAPLFG